MKIIRTPGSNLAFPDILSRNVTLEGYQKHQLQHKKIPRDIEFFDENGNPVLYKIQHEDNPHDTCNVFYPIHRQQGNDEKILRLQNDGESYTLNSISNEFPTQPNLPQTVLAWARLLINSAAYAIPYPIHQFYMKALTQLTALSAL